MDLPGQTPRQPTIPTMKTPTISSILAAEPWYYDDDRRCVKFRADGAGEVLPSPVVAKDVSSTPTDLGRTRDGLYTGRELRLESPEPHSPKRGAGDHYR
jgi:hypothetical protein